MSLTFCTSSHWRQFVRICNMEISRSHKALLNLNVGGRQCLAKKKKKQQQQRKVKIFICQAALRISNMCLTMFPLKSGSDETFSLLRFSSLTLVETTHKLGFTSLHNTPQCQSKLLHSLAFQLFWRSPLTSFEVFSVSSLLYKTGPIWSSHYFDLNNGSF